MGDYGGNREDVDLDAYPTAKKLVEKCVEFFDKVQNLYANQIRHQSLLPVSAHRY
jgi:hypothetical protein